MAKIWIWGMPATGDLKRPFKPPAGLFGGMQQQNGPQTDKVCGGLSDHRLQSKRLKKWLLRFVPRTSKVVSSAYCVEIVASKSSACLRNGGVHLC